MADNIATHPYRRYPKTRYVVATVGPGIPAWCVTWLAWLLPDRLQDLAAVRF